MKIKATTIKRDNGYQIIGLEKTPKKGVYEKTYLYGLGSRTYKTEQGAIRAIKNNNCEYLETEKENHYTVKVKNK